MLAPAYACAPSHRTSVNQLFQSASSTRSSNSKMDTADNATQSEEDLATLKEAKPKTAGTKRKFVSQTQFNLQSTVVDMRSEMTTLISLIKETLGSMNKRVCSESESQSTAADVIPSAVANGNQFASFS